MRISSYEIILPLIDPEEREIEDKTLLVNGLYGSIDVVDRDVADMLQAGEFTGLSVPMRERLAARGHITRRSPEDELADVKLLGRIFGKLGGGAVGPVILPTYDCNFRCPYCFESHRLSKGKEWLCAGMSDETVDAVFAALKKRKAQGYRVEGCSLYGGEPLLKENKETVRNICEHAKEMGLTMSAITNGYDLDDYLDILETYKFDRLQITVDGVGELNDRRRLHRDGLPTYDKIMNNIPKALACGVDVKLRVNVNRENIDGIADLIADIRSRGIPEATRQDVKDRSERRKQAEKDGKPMPKEKGLFSYYFKAVSEPLESPTRVTEKEIMDRILAAGIPVRDAIDRQSQYSMVVGPLEEVMKKDGYPRIDTAFCGAEGGALVIGPDGMLHTCWDLVAKKEYSVGCLDTEKGQFLYNFDKAKWRLRTPDRMEACQVCPYCFLCRGGCAAEALHEHASQFREYCGEYAEIFAYVASRVVAMQWLETKEDELSVSLLGPLLRLSGKERERLTKLTSPKEILDMLKEVEFVW